MSNIFAMIIAVSINLGMLATSMIHLHQLHNKLETTKQSSFIDRHSKTISRLGNVLLLFGIGFLFYLSMRIPAQDLPKFLREKQYSNNSLLRLEISGLLGGITGFIGMAGIFAGFLSVFQSHITKTKRIVLLIICLLPIILTTTNLLIRHHLGSFSIDTHLIIQLGLMSFLAILLINGATIIFGKHFLTFLGIATSKVFEKIQKKKSSTP